MVKGNHLHGFTVQNARAIPELEGTLYELIHEKSGAKLCWLDRDDENMTFAISFKTIPEDSTGVFHILEHSVLCGSDKYPVKEPFVELLKSSVQTFLNAMTYPDKTVYPLSSRNRQDFLNLISVYLDAVLHPAIYHNPHIFRQEGWRYDFTEETPAYQGVVLNEMRGAYSDPQTVLEAVLTSRLFPDTSYRHESGGHPDHIMDLTYEMFLNAHRRFYHPSNAQIALVGRVDTDAVLSLIDRELSRFDRYVHDIALSEQGKTKYVRCDETYQIGAEEPPENRAIIARAIRAGRFDEKERLFAAQVLADYLAGDNEAPLKKALVGKGMAEDFRVSFHGEILEPFISWEIWNTDAKKEQELVAAVRAAVESILTNGLDQDRLEASLNSFAFRLRDKDSGMPRSLMEALELLGEWNYGGDPVDGLLCEETLSALRNGMKQGLFEKLLREWFLDEETGVLAVLFPSVDLGEEKAAREAEKMRNALEGLSKEEKAALQEEFGAFQAWQQTPDTEEAVKTLPTLGLSDLNAQPSPLMTTVEEANGFRVIHHHVTSDLCYMTMNFLASDLSLEELPAASLMCALLGKVNTGKHSSAEIQLLIKRFIGSLRFQMNVFGDRVYFSAFAACLRENAEKAAELLAEVLTDTDFSDIAAMRNIMASLNMEAQMSLITKGHRYACIRSAATLSAHGAAKEMLEGASFVDHLAKWNGDAPLPDLRGMLESLCVRERMTIGVNEAVPDKMILYLTDAIPRGMSCEQSIHYAPLTQVSDIITIPAPVGYAGMCLRPEGVAFHGSQAVAANILNYGYLWNRVRVQGGAYGVGLIPRDDGDCLMYSYRDPSPAHTLKVFKGAAASLIDFAEENQDISRFILGSVSAFDPYLNAVQKIMTAESRYFKGMDEETVCQHYRELIQTTSEDLIRFADALNSPSCRSAHAIVASSL